MSHFTRVISTIDSHTEGEPTRLVVSGLPSLQGSTMADKMLYARKELDGIRRLLLFEPRGHQDIYGALLLSPTIPEADFGLIFMNTQQYTTMCGHVVIGAATTVIETGMIDAVEPETSVTFETPVGLVHTQVRVEKGRVYEVAFNNTPAFVYQRDVCLSDPVLGELPVDIVYSGGFFALLEANRIDMELVPANARALADLGTRLRAVANAQLSVGHPGLPFVTTIDAVEFHNLARRETDGTLRARNVATFGERTIDRSPCGTGTGAKIALLRAKGELAVGQPYISESIIGTQFIGRIIEETNVGDYRAVIPRIAGRAYLTGFHQFVFDPNDPFPYGFSLT